jgi:hypothetical protein
MNELIVPPHGNEIVPFSPRPVGQELSADVESFAEYASSYMPRNVDALVSGGVAQLELDVEHASRPATTDDIINQLAILGGCFPTGQNNELMIYGRCLAEDVIAAKPSLFALEHACRTLRRTSKFRPVIAEVLSAIATAEQLLRKAQYELRRLPSRLEDWACEEKRIEQRRQRLLEPPRDDPFADEWPL